MEFKRKSTKWRAARIKCEERWTEAGESRSRRKHCHEKEGKGRKWVLCPTWVLHTHISINTQDSNSSRWPRDYSPSIPTPPPPPDGPLKLCLCLCHSSTVPGCLLTWSVLTYCYTWSSLSYALTVSAAVNCITHVAATLTWPTAHLGELFLPSRKAV